MLDRALDLVGAHCDLESRVRDIPPSARVRGVWVRGCEAELARSGALERYVAICGSTTSALTWYPCAEVVTRLAVAGALHASPAELLYGMRELGRREPVRFAQSLLGRTLVRLLSRDPVRLLQQGVAARRQTCDYGRWELDVSEPRRAIMVHRNEYGWLEGFVLGSAWGTFESIGVPVQIEAHMENAYNGTFDMRW